MRPQTKALSSASESLSAFFGTLSGAAILSLLHLTLNSRGQPHQLSFIR